MDYTAEIEAHRSFASAHARALEAFRAGDVAVIKALLEECPELASEDHYEKILYLEAVCAGSGSPAAAAMAVWDCKLLDRDHKDARDPLEFCVRAAVRAAADNGHAALIRWLADQAPDLTAAEWQMLREYAAERAAEGGKGDALRGPFRITPAEEAAARAGAQSLHAQAAESQKRALMTAF